ncbi:DUF397 domain-containing protein [Amycolatopsis nigrescens]|uniref:DUF397 domain-containing protein n=1 Tax=Amycolatopsis nigrescens TaxID=381445 RepID=UPI00039E303A|nr:DUF397 domain-containing protein [Amycolatopsis nigrescens]
MGDLVWRKSSYSGTEDDTSNCVEVAFTCSATLLRDSKQPTAGCLELRDATWRAFVGALT